MADNTIAGMFTDPEIIRRKRIAEIAAAQGQAPRGGSISDLNAMVAGGGYNTGRMMAEGIAGMFGMKTPEEDQAAQLRDMVSNMNVDISTSKGKMLVAKLLNRQGLTEQAMKMFELGKAQEAEELDMQVKRAGLEKRNIQVIGQRYNEDSMSLENVYGYYDPTTGKVVETKLEGQATPTSDNDPVIKGGDSAADYVKKQGWAN